MKRNKNSKIRWFFRSFTISLIIIFSCLTLALGFCEGYARMESRIKGEKIEIIERKNHRIYFLNRDIASAEFLENLDKFIRSHLTKVQ